MTQPSTALVVGCGLAGPVAAIALARAGYSVTIHEARTSSTEGGVFLNLASNGLAALRTLDIDRAAIAEGFATPNMTMWSGSGKKLGDVANGMTLADGTTSITVRRAGLHSALRGEAERRGIPILTGRRFVEATTLADGVALARFDDGSEATADLLVGADGLWSQTRRLLAPDAPPPRYTGILSIGGFAKVPALEPTPETFHMVFGRDAFFGYTVTPARDVYWFANIGRAEEPARGELAAIPTDVWRRQLLSLFEADRGPMRRILEAADTIHVSPVHDMPTVPRWHHGRTVLIGDAAHATSPSAGQGASMAFEDAIVLAACLRHRGDESVEHALGAYEARRRPRVEKVVRYSARIGNTKVLGPFGRRLRDALMPFVLEHFATPKAHAWLYAHPIAHDMTL